MTRQAVLKMVAVWVLAFLLYGPAILFWESAVGRSIVPPHECDAEFYFTWYFLLTASTFEFFTPFVSVAFLNLSIYLNIHRRTKEGRAWAEEALGALGARRADGGPRQDCARAVFFMKTRKVSSSEPTAISAVIEDDGDGLSARVLGEPGSGHILVEEGRLSPGGGGGGGGPAGSQLFRATGSSCPLPDRRLQRSRLSRDKKIAKSLAVIVCTFGLCWAPYTLLMIIRAACSGTCVAHYWYDITFWLLWLNSAINPVLYPLCHSSFRRAFAKILCPKRQSVQPQIEVQSC